MCGIAGFALHAAGERPELARLESMTRALAHRGPDSDGHRIVGRIALGFRRLAIIDVSGGDQPLSNETDDVITTLNGEIYNFRQLRAELESRGHRFATRSDAETLVHRYEEVGHELVHELVGMYALAIADRRQGREELLLARDRLGIKPLYYIECERGLAWASEPKALLELGWTAREMRAPALLDYLVQGYTGGADAAWVGMRRLSPGCVLRWRPGEKARVERYWDLPTDALREPVPARERDAEVLEWLDRVVADRLVADVPLGAFLSGGVDSSAVVDSMVRAQPGRPIVCSVGFRERSHDELDLARETARRLEVDHKTAVLEADPRAALETLPWFFDEPLADPSTLPTWLVSGMAREHVTVALSGDGGDETFAGYRRYLHDAAENRLRRAIGSPGRAAMRLAGSVYPRLEWAPRFLRGRTFLTNVGDDPARAYFRSVCMLEREGALALLHPELAASLHAHDPADAFRAHYDRPRVDDPLYRAQYADFHTYLPDQILTKVDRASMAVSLEVRVPILDHRFVERFAPLPAEEKIRAGRGKHAFRRALRPRLRDEILDGTKRGFDTPLRAWLRGPMQAACTEALRSLPTEWFRQAALERVLGEHQAGRRDHGRLLWSLLVLEHWRRRHGVKGIAG